MTAANYGGEELDFRLTFGEDSQATASGHTGSYISPTIYPHYDSLILRQKMRFLMKGGGNSLNVQPPPLFTNNCATHPEDMQ